MYLYIAIGVYVGISHSLSIYTHRVIPKYIYLYLTVYLFSYPYR